MKYREMSKLSGEIINNVTTSLFLLSLCLFISLFLSNLLYAKTDVFFSPRGLIKEAIIKAINSSERSIDIAIFIFTSGDIAEALSEAKNRGLKIRIIIDERQRNSRHPVLEFLQDEGFDLQFLKGNVGGFMHNTFAIFDTKLVATGSYNWTEYAEKFNYENVVFIDEPDVVERFQIEFESLYNKEIKSDGKEEKTRAILPHSRDEERVKLDELEPPPIKETEGKKEATPIPLPSTILDSTKEDIQYAKPDTDAGYDGVRLGEVTSEGFLNVSFEEFDNIFGRESKLQRVEMKELWAAKFKGRYVKWSGEVCHKGISLYDWNKVGITHKHGSADVEITFDWTKQEKVRQLQPGDTIIYSGKLDSLRGLTSPYRVIDGDVLKINNIELEQR